MINQEIVQQDFGSVEERFAGRTGGRELSLLLAAHEETGAALARAQEAATLEAQDILSQADEALILG
jgi:hypothetical protein